MSVAAAILAAGQGARMAGERPKPLVTLGDRPLVTWALDAAITSGLTPVLLVVGAEHGAVTAAARPDVVVVQSARWHDGIAHSLHALLDALEPSHTVSAVCVGLADQPLMGAEAYRRLEAASATGATLAVATYDGKRRNPVLLGRAIWPEARRLTGDTGARTLLDGPGVIEVDCTGTGDPRDVDTLEDLRALEEEPGMNISDEFRVGVGIDEAWRVLLDIERIAPCMPGAQLQEVEGDEYRGIVKVKVGPISAQYKGVARIVEADEGAHRMTIKAEGRDTRGQGNASATITAALSPDGEGTRVSIDTDLNVTGKVAQFGRGVMADVSSKLLGQFVTCLESNVLAGDRSPASAPAPAPAAAPPEAAPAVARAIDAPEAEAVDLVRMAGGAVARRVVPALIAATVVFGVVVWLISR